MTVPGSEVLLFGIPLTPQTFLIGLLIIAVTYLIKKNANNKNSGSGTRTVGSKDDAFQWILNRRTVMVKEYIEGGKISDEELRMILEAGNWAPTHAKTEPWRFCILSSSSEIEKYLDFLEDWYYNNEEELEESDLVRFNKKLESIRQQWPYRISRVILLGMRRQSKPDKRLPEWEEICAFAMAVQNMHLMASSMDNIGGFWSSHTWCKEARDSSEFREEYFGSLLPDADDRVFGAFVLGKYPAGKKYTSARTSIDSKINWRK